MDGETSVIKPRISEEEDIGTSDIVSDHAVEQHIPIEQGVENVAIKEEENGTHDSPAEYFGEQPPAKRGRGRPKKTASGNTHRAPVEPPTFSLRERKVETAASIPESNGFKNSPEEISEIPATTKRGRGRPRKTATSTTRATGSSVQEKAGPTQRKKKRGPGRPRKPPAPSKGVATTKKAKKRKLAVTTSSGQNGVKRGRGRPRKHEGGSLKKRGNPKKQGLGRPKNVEVQKDVATASANQISDDDETAHENGADNSTAADFQVQAKRPRGRPKKRTGKTNNKRRFSSVAVKKVKVGVDSGVKSAKRGRGRPKKNAGQSGELTMESAAADEAEIAEGTASTNGNRGIDRVTAADAYRALDSSVQATGKRGRGRPKKEQPPPPPPVDRTVIRIPVDLDMWSEAGTANEEPKPSNAAVETVNDSDRIETLGAD